MKEKLDMTLVKFAPLHQMVNADAHFDTVLDSLFGRDSHRRENAKNCWSPRIDVEETDDAIVLTADLPGLTKDGIRISTKDDILTIQGERKSETEVESRNFRRIERVSGTFCRTFKMPATIQPEHVEASYTDGVLKVIVAKSESAKRVDIEIKR